MPLSQYNIIRFVLDHAYKDHALCGNPQWNEWFRTVSRMFRHRMPIALIEGLRLKGNDVINQLCDSEIAKLEIREEAIERRKEFKKKRHAHNIERCRIKNNEILHEQKEHRKLINELGRKANEAYIEEMLPEWKLELQGVTEKRNKELRDIWKPTP